MSRHERRGALVIVTMMAVVVGLLWAISAHQPAAPQADRDALLQWAAEADSARHQAAERDSVEKASRNSHKHRAHSGSRKSSRKESRKSPSKPGKGHRDLPPSVPNY